MIARSQLAEIGTFNKPHGIKGEISTSFDPEVIDLVDDFGHVFVELDGLMVPFTILSSRPKGSETLLLTLKGITDEKKASALTGLPLYIEESMLPEDLQDGDDGFYIEDLIGFTLADGDTVVGVISGYDDSTDNVLFEVTAPDGAALLVPASPDLIEDVDIDGKTVTMSLPQGLLDL